MSQPHNWTILGEDALADRLRAAAAFVPTDRAIKIVMGHESSDATAFSPGAAAVMGTGARFVPLYAAFEAVEEAKRAIDMGEVGRIYGCFASLRVPRGGSAEEVQFDALLPILGVALDLLGGQVERVFARRASLFAEDDAWFVTLRLEDETIVTIEAMASNPVGSPHELLIEVTGSDLVIRAEPTRQAVLVEPLDGPPRPEPWWEDLGERYLRLVMERSATTDDQSGSRLRVAWSAIQRSVESAMPANVGY